MAKLELKITQADGEVIVREIEGFLHPTLEAALKAVKEEADMAFCKWDKVEIVWTPTPL